MTIREMWNQTFLWIGKYYKSMLLNSIDIISFALYFSPFPIKTYMALNNSFRHVSRAIFSTISAAQALRLAMDSMIQHQENVQTYLSTFEFRSIHVLSISDQAAKAILHASKALHR